MSGEDRLGNEKVAEVDAVRLAYIAGSEAAERAMSGVVARLVEAAGGELRVSYRALVDDPPDLQSSREGDEFVYKTRPSR